MANEEEDSMLYKSMLNKTLGLPDFNQYSYLFEDQNDDSTESLLNTPSTDAEMSDTAAEMSESIMISEELLAATDDTRPTESFSETLSIAEPKDIEQVTQRNQQLQNYWESQQKESQLIEEKLSNIRNRVVQNENHWKKEKNKLLSPQSRIPKAGRTIVSALDLQLEAEREKRMELEVQCGCLNRQLQELQKDVEYKASASLRLETLKQMQKRHAEEIEALQENAERAQVNHAKEIADLEDAWLQSREHIKELEGEKVTLISEIEQLHSAQKEDKATLSVLEEKLKGENNFRGRIEKECNAWEQKFKRQSLDMASLREVVIGKEEEKAVVEAKLAATEIKKQQLQDAFDVLNDQQQLAEQEMKSLQLQLIDTEKNYKVENTKTKIEFEQESKRQKKISEEDFELQIQQLQENHHTVTDNLKAEVEVCRSQVADLNEKYESERDMHLKLRTKLEQLGGFEDTDELSLQNHVTRIETEHAKEIKELLQGLGRDQSAAVDWSSHFESRNESKDDFSTPFKVKLNTTNGNVSGAALSPILREEHSEMASTGSDNTERKIDGLMEEIGQMGQEREDLLAEPQQEVSSSETSGPCDGSRLIEEPTAISHDTSIVVSESPLGEDNPGNGLPSNDLLDDTLLLLNNLKDLMDCQEDENEKEVSVLDQLEALSEMMQGEAHLNNSVVLHESSSVQKLDVSAMRASVHSRVSTGAPSSSTVRDEEFYAQKEELWRMLVAELRRRILFLEHDRDEVVRITSDLLERERDASRLKFQSAVSTSRREAFEEFQALLEMGRT
ncbi:MAG: hypothetical protein SGBAC_008983 [Bacillariaceae sp.]